MSTMEDEMTARPALQKLREEKNKAIGAEIEQKKRCGVIPFNLRWLVRLQGISQ